MLRPLLQRYRARAQGGLLSQGYTQYMIEYLREQRGYLLENEARTLGGEGRVTQQLLVRCCEIFKAYVRLAVQTIEQEFPHHDVLHAMSVFNIRERRSNDDSLDHLMWTDRRQASLERLAQVCNVDAEALRSQFMDLEPIARYQAGSARCSSFEAWRTAILRCRDSKPQVRERRSHHVLLQVLVKYGAFSGLTTSGVEQAFSKLQRFQPAERKCMLAETAEDEAYLMLLNDSKAVCIRSFASERGRSGCRTSESPVPAAQHVSTAGSQNRRCHLTT